MKNNLILFLIGSTLTLASCGGASTSNPKDVANAFLKAMKEQNLSVIKQTSTDRIANNVSLSFDKATAESINQLSNFKTAFESEEKVGNVYFDRFLYGEKQRDTMILKLIQVSGKWKVAGLSQKPFTN